MPWSVKPSWSCFVESPRRFHHKAKKPTRVAFHLALRTRVDELELRWAAEAALARGPMIA